MSDTDTDIPEVLEKLPLDVWHRERGARMVPFAGYEMPIQYPGELGGIIAEHNWTRENAGLFDVSHMGQLSVSGPDGDQTAAAEALEALMPGDFSALKPGRMRYSMLLDEHGGILDDLMVTNAGDHYAIVVNGATKWDDIGHMREFLPDEITLSHHDEQALLALQGPKAALALGRLVPSVENLSFMQGMAATWGEVPLYITRSGYTGEDGFEISVPMDDAAMLADALVAMDEVMPIGLGARDSLRLEAGLPLYGHDITQDTDPVSAGLSFAISKKRREERGFPAADRILDTLANGPVALRVGMKVEGRMAAREGAPIFAGDTQVGMVTSGGFAPTVGAPVAMGYVESEHATCGTRLQIEMRGKMLDTIVTDMPFIPHRYHRKAKA